MPPTRRVSLGGIVASPRRAMRVGMAILRGHLVRVSCALRGVRFECGRNLRVFGRLDIRGPGRVVFGDDVRVEMTVTPWTGSPDAVITVGSGTFLNGTRFGCVRAITIGPRSILADARLMDTDYHSTRIDRHSPDAPVRVSPVTLGENVWIAAQAGILPGTTIGDNSVVGFGAVCSGSYPANVLIAGNPARVVRDLGGPS